MEGKTVIRLTVQVGGHTHVYVYPPAEAEQMIDIICNHMCTGRIPVLAGRMLGELVLMGIREKE